MMRRLRAQRERQNGREESGMIERVLSRHSTLARGEKLHAYALSDRRGFGRLKDAILRLLRKIGEFLAAGGPLS